MKNEINRDEQQRQRDEISKRCYCLIEGDETQDLTSLQFSLDANWGPYLSNYKN